VSPRASIAFTPEEAAAFVVESHTVTCATLGRDGWPHLMPLWYVVRGDDGITAAQRRRPAASQAAPPQITAAQRRRPAASQAAPPFALWAWTYAKSQKVRNLERDARCTLQIEAGVAYDELRGLMLRCEARIHRDVADVERLGEEIMRRYADLADPTRAADAELPPGVANMVRRQAPKRVALQFLERDRVSWDHRKLG
jgi:pyridoxamine 5'-phosphate oxidase-like protein